MERYSVDVCPVTTQVQILMSKWGFPLFAELAKNNSTFGRLKRALKPITNKTLSACLKKAERAGHVIRQGAKYSLSNKGKKAFDAVRTLSTKEKQCTACPGREVCTA